MSSSGRSPKAGVVAVSEEVSEEAEKLAEEITAEWKVKPLPVGRATECGKATACGKSCAECWELEQVFAGKQRDALAAEVLLYQKAALSLLTAEYFVYFLPAFLTASLRAPLAMADLTESLVFHLTPAGGGNQLLALRLPLLSSAQRRLVKAFLELQFSISSPEPGVVEKDLHEEAMERFDHL